jgi:deoxyadenosine/deoxycytidine kinase
MQRLEICGGIASGKTTLAALLSKLGISPVYEDFSVNPFYKDFYHDPSANAFETEITFLLQHFHKIKTAIRRQMTFGCDFSPTLDLAYADVTLKSRQQKVFKAVYQETRKTIGSPAFLIHLKCDPVEELRRIRRRRREPERSITTGYLTALNVALTSRFTRQSAHTKIIEIDSGRIDFAHDSDDQKKVLALIQKRLRAAKQ